MHVCWDGHHLAAIFCQHQCRGFADRSRGVRYFIEVCSHVWHGFALALMNNNKSSYYYVACDDLHRILRARLEYLRETFQIKENDFLTFDAVVYLVAGLLYWLVTAVFKTIHNFKKFCS